MAEQDITVEAVLDRISALGDVSLIAYFRDGDTVMNVVSQLPYVEVDGPYLSTRPGTDAQALDNVILKDGTQGYILITGGKLTREETQAAVALLTRYGEEQMFAAPGIETLFNDGKDP